MGATVEVLVVIYCNSTLTRYFHRSLRIRNSLPDCDTAKLLLGHIDESTRERERMQRAGKRKTLDERMKTQKKSFSGEKFHFLFYPRM